MLKRYATEINKLSEIELATRDVMQTSAACVSLFEFTQNCPEPLSRPMRNPLLAPDTGQKPSRMTLWFPRPRKRDAPRNVSSSPFDLSSLPIDILNLILHKVAPITQLCLLLACRRTWLHLQSELERAWVSPLYARLYVLLQRCRMSCRPLVWTSRGKKLGAETSSRQIDAWLRDDRATRHAERLVFVTGLSGSGVCELFARLDHRFNGATLSGGLSNIAGIRRMTLEIFQSILSAHQDEIEREMPHLMYIQDIDRDDFSFTPRLAAHLSNLYDQFRDTLKLFDARRVYLPPNALYFAEHVHRIASPGYTASAEDLRMMGGAFRGLRELRLQHQGATLRLVAYTGSASRHRFSRALHGVHAVLFLVNASTYNARLSEDEFVNPIQEARKMFDDTINSWTFRQCDVGVLATHAFEFRGMIQTVPFSVCFADFRVGASEEKHLLDKFKRLNRMAGYHRDVDTALMDLGQVVDIADYIVKISAGAGSKK